MEHRVVGPGPYRATRLWNETVELFRARMPLRKHRCRFKSYEHCFTASEAVDWLHELLRNSQNFGPEVTRKQTVQLLRKFLKNHVIEDIKGKWGQEDFEDNRHLYRFPPSSPLKPYPKKPLYQRDNSEMWFKRHSIAIGEVPACRLKILEELPHWVLSAMKCLANWPNCTDWKQPMYLGFEKDVFKTIADYYGHLTEPLLTFHLFDAFVSVLGLLPKEKMAIEAFQICCLLLPPENRRKLQLLMRMMARICLNKDMPPLCDGFGTRTLMVQTFSRCILCSKDEVDLDELLAARLVTFLMDNYQEILKVPLALQTSIEERVAHLRRVQIKYPGADMDTTLSAPSFCRQISPEEFEYQRAYGSQQPLAALLEEVIADDKLSSKEKKKKLKQGNPCSS
ncbi:DEP domain-containing protein 1B [Apodemus speciosus]|uniref:DEP domain-containing protein 1B n=1 Tax=Apodemus speciosus TaxID=105296 RepID=A0ABQ0FH17_APOSI